MAMHKTLSVSSIPFSPQDNPISFPLEMAYLCGEDGLVQHQNKLYFHFQKYAWDLAFPHNNPYTGEHKRRVIRRLEQGPLDISEAKFLPGKYLLGISPFIHSYYHFHADLIPFLMCAPDWTVLIPESLPTAYITFLQRCRFPLYALSSGVYQVEQLMIPMLTNPDWNLEKIATIQNFFKREFPKQDNPSRKLYISRKLIQKRHLRNEEELLPYLTYYGFQRVFLERFSIEDQVQLMRSVSHLIAPHGAGLTNILFAPKNARILEVRPTLTSGQFCFEQLCSHGWKYYEYVVPPQTNTFSLNPFLLLEVLKRWFPSSITKGINV